MKKAVRFRFYILLEFLVSFSSGILSSVMTVTLLEKGITLSFVPICLTCYSATVIILEVPSGIAADMIGRKKTFLISMFFSACSMAALLMGNGVTWIVFAMLLFGVARAFSSGSFEALFIDQYIDEYGKDQLHKVTARMSIIDSLGMALGALVGGVLPVIMMKLFPENNQYSLNIIGRMVLSILVGCAGSFLLLEDVFHSKEKKHNDGWLKLREHLATSYMVIKGSQTLKGIFLSVLGIGIILGTLEVYYQPHMTSLLPRDNMVWLLGVISFLYFGAVTLGSIFAEQILEYIPQAKVLFLLSRVLMTGMMFFMALQTNIWSFMVGYVGVYLFIGVSDIGERVLTNEEIPSKNRASLLSVSSLLLQLGGFISNCISSILIRVWSIPCIWLAGAGALIIITGISGIIMTQKKTLQEIESK